MKLKHFIYHTHRFLTILLLGISMFPAPDIHAAATSDSPPALHRRPAALLGETPVCWNGRICPMQTMARDVTGILYGGYSYKGLSPEQVLAGWLVNYDEWRIDYIDSYPELKGIPPYPVTRRQKKLADRLELVNWLATAHPFRISDVEALPSPAKMKAELLYNRFVRFPYVAVFALALGLYLLLADVRSQFLPAVISWLLFIYVAVSWALLWYISGHIPLSNGPETMTFMAMAALAVAALCRKGGVIRAASLIVASMALSVVVMADYTPSFSPLISTLASPLLSLHVMALMLSYTLFLVIALLSLLILLPRRTQMGAADPAIPSLGDSRHLSYLSRRLLLPAFCLLFVGIVIGSIWAKQAWGRYWGWDPKETCSLVMLIVYALPLLWGNRRLKMFRREKPLAIYLLLAVLTVIFTYFGANYLMSGLHSYV